MLVVCATEIVPKQQRSTYTPNDEESDRRNSLVLHLIIRVDEVLIVVLLIILAELLVGLGEINVLAARAGADDIGRVDLLHVILIWLLDCLLVRVIPGMRVTGEVYLHRPGAIKLAGLRLWLLSYAG